MMTVHSFATDLGHSGFRVRHEQTGSGILDLWFRRTDGSILNDGDTRIINSLLSSVDAQRPTFTDGLLPRHDQRTRNTTEYFVRLVHGHTDDEPVRQFMARLLRDAPRLAALTVQFVPALPG